MQIICCPVSVMTECPDIFGRTSGHGVFTMNFVFGPYLKISVSMCFCIYFDFISWLCAYMFIWFMLVKILVFSKFSKHMILHIWKVFNLYLWPEFKNLFNYTIWNFEMILKILFEKIFSKLPISYLIFYVHHLFLKIAFFKRFSKKGY